MPSVDLSSPTFTFDPSDPEGFRGGMFRPGPSLGARATGATLYELPPGQAVCPYHFELGEEEWVLALSGRPSIRTPEGVRELAPMELAFFPPRRDGAHQILNRSEATARVLMFSNVVLPTATAYPDSGKVGVYTGDEAEDLIVRRSSAVGYFDGETG